MSEDIKIGDTLTVMLEVVTFDQADESYYIRDRDEDHYLSTWITKGRLQELFSKSHNDNQRYKDLHEKYQKRGQEMQEMQRVLMQNKVDIKHCEEAYYGLSQEYHKKCEKIQQLEMALLSMREQNESLLNYREQIEKENARLGGMLTDRNAYIARHLFLKPATSSELTIEESIAHIAYLSNKITDYKELVGSNRDLIQQLRAQLREHNKENELLKKERVKLWEESNSKIQKCYCAGSKECADAFEKIEELKERNKSLQKEIDSFKANKFWPAQEDNCCAPEKETLSARDQLLKELKDLGEWYMEKASREKIIKWVDNLEYVERIRLAQEIGVNCVALELFATGAELAAECYQRLKNYYMEHVKK